MDTWRCEIEEIMNLSRTSAAAAVVGGGGGGSPIEYYESLLTVFF